MSAFLAFPPICFLEELLGTALVCVCVCVCAVLVPSGCAVHVERSAWMTETATSTCSRYRTDNLML